MKRTLTLLAVISALACALPAQANDRRVTLPIAGAMAANGAQAALGDSVKFYFGNQPSPSVKESMGSDKTSQKTNAFGKSDEKACNWAFLSAMLRLQKHAKSVGADAVINIVSNHNNVEWSSATEFECHAGAVMAGVALKGEFVKLSDK